MSDGGGSLGDAWIQIRAANDPSAFTISWRRALVGVESASSVFTYKTLC